MIKFFKLFLLSLGILFSASSLNAYGNINTLTISSRSEDKEKERRYIIATPKNWDRVDVKKPIDYKFVHSSKQRECYLVLSGFAGPVSKNTILDEILGAVSEIYGDKFISNQNYNHINLDETEGATFFTFAWDSGNSIDLVHALAFQDRASNDCIRCFVFVDKSFNSIKEIDFEKTNLLEDFSDFNSRISFSRGK